MIDKRFFLGLLLGASILLGVGAALAFLQFTSVEAQDNPDKPNLFPIETQCSSADIDPSKLPEACLNTPDQLITANVIPEDAVPMVSYNAYLRIPGSGLRPRRSDVEWATNGSGGCVYASSGNPITVLNTPVYLPDGVTVKYVRMYFNDQDETYNSNAWFTVYDMYGDLVSEWSMSTSGSAGEGYATTSEFTHTVNYDAYSYVVNWRPSVLGSNMQLCGFRLYYNDPSSLVYMPLIENDAP